MKDSWAVLITAVVAFATLSVTEVEGSVIIIVPRSLEKNAVNKLYMSLFGIDAAGSVAISIENTDSRKTIAETVAEVAKGETEKTIELKVPETSEYQVRIWANGTFDTSDGYSFYEQEEVYFHSTHSTITFIQTDKPLYKPGQAVKFRVLPVDRTLRPLGKDIQGDIWVENTEGSRIAQWKNVSLGEGIQQFDFLLSNEPPLGQWKINALVQDVVENAYFDVKEYVLPKFEVTVKPPSYVLADAETIPFTICARYTYGKDVQGTLKINSSLESYSWATEKLPVVEFEDKIDGGCYKYDLNVSLVDSEFSYSYRRIEVTAEVTEEGTGVSKNGTTTVQRTNNALTMEFLDEDFKQYFKPGIPYSKKIKVTKPDDSPAPQEVVEICATISRQRVLQQWWATRKVKYCRNYTSDDEGIILFKVPPQKPDTTNLFLEAKSMRYANTQSVSGRPQIYQSQASSSVQPYYSPSKSYIQVQDAEESLPCGTSQNVKILYTAQEGGNYVFHYNVISKGEVILKGSKEVTFASGDDVSGSMCKDALAVNDVRISLVPSQKEQDDTETVEDIDCSAGPVGTAEINIDVTSSLSPSFRLLVYYIRDDDETVADSAKFEVEKCFQNKVEFHFGDEEKQPGDKTSITLKASPNSMCGVKVLDKSITLLDSSDPLTKEKITTAGDTRSETGVMKLLKLTEHTPAVEMNMAGMTCRKIFQELKKYDTQQYYHRNHCNDNYRKDGKNKAAQSMIMPPRPWSSSQYADAVTAFEDTGFVVMSDLKMLTRPCSRGQNSYENYGGIALASVGVRGGGMNAPRNVANRRKPLKKIGKPAPTRRPPPPPRRTPVYMFSTASESAESAGAGFSADRSPVNEAAKFGGNGATKSVVDVRTLFPETWLFELQSVGETGQIVSKAALPHTITEWIGNAVCINDADGLGLSNTARIKGFQAFFVGFTLPYSVIRGEKVPLIISVLNYLDKCLPITRTISVLVASEDGSVTDGEPASETICVCGGKPVTLRYMFTPDKIGTMNITVLAESARSSDVCGDKETAEVVARDMAIKSLKVEAEGFPQENVNSFLFCPEDFDGSTYNGKLDLNIPDNAVEGSARAFISLSGDIMGPAIDGLDRLVRLPTGCGEQNMVLFSPNIVVLGYLTSIGKLTEAIKTKAITNLQSGYQRELKYRHPDGSFSAFGVSDREGSMWLTAFVLKSFSQARPYITIDAGDINQTVTWIVRKQQEDGCFPQVGRMLSQGMKGGLGSRDENSRAPLTAYVLTALLTSGYSNETLTNAALACIADDKELTPYTAALYAYTTALADNADADKYLTWLDEKAFKEGDEVYWKNINGSKSLDVETAAYAMMTILKRKGDNGLPQALSIVRRLTRMRNAQGGFVSTQDTVVGLEAISLFAAIISQDPVELTVKLNGPTLDQTLSITEEDKLLVKKLRVPVLPSAVDVTATGAGCGLIQAAVRYNTLTVEKQKFFSLSIEAARTDDCKTAKISVCASYLPESQRSNMALVEIKLVSGFAADKESLDKLINDARVKLKRFEIENNNVVLYFNELSNDNKCFSFSVEEVTAVEDSKPATAKVYDYYAKEKEESVDYQIAGSC